VLNADDFSVFGSRYHSIPGEAEWIAPAQRPLRWDVWFGASRGQNFLTSIPDPMCSSKSSTVRKRSSNGGTKTERHSQTVNNTAFSLHYHPVSIPTFIGADKDYTLTLVSLGLSILASVSSAFLWLVQYLQKKPRLKVFWSRLRFPGWTYGERDGKVMRPMSIQIAIANLSEAPNAIIKLRFRIKLANGGWVESGAYEPLTSFDFEQAKNELATDQLSTLPVNLAPKEIIRLTRVVQILTPANEAFVGWLAEPFQAEVAVTDLFNRTKISIVTKPEPLDAVTEE